MQTTQIIATLGPSSWKRLTLHHMISAGMNVARLNMSHGNHHEHRQMITMSRSIAAEYRIPLLILVDLQGPKLRIGKVRPNGVTLIAGQNLLLTTEEIIGTSISLPIRYKALPPLVQSGDRIFLGDDLLELQVLGASKSEIRTKVIVGGHVKSNRGMNLPDTPLNIPTLTEKDKSDLRFALEQHADWIAHSFVRSASDILELKSFVEQGPKPQRHVPIIAKIEKPEAIQNIDEIIDVCDGIMVARGDLGVEVGLDKVPVLQKMIIAKCKAAGKPVITATEMLRSMVDSHRPTRAEVSDVANAVWDGSTAVMLSNETASGAYPVEAIKTMRQIIWTAENASEWYAP